MAGIGPLSRWRSPELAAGYWGSPAATVAPGPHGATYARAPPRGAMTPGPQQRAPGSGGRTDGLRTSPVGRAGVAVRRDGDGRRGGAGRDPGARVVVMAGAAHDVRGGEFPEGQRTSPGASSANSSWAFSCGPASLLGAGRRPEWTAYIPWPRLALNAWAASTAMGTVLNLVGSGPPSNLCGHHLNSHRSSRSADFASPKSDRA